ncbi:hypothetical protein TWF696_005811 [Orbilia brochopaga]|uniref:Uncharacterized protein n=1 Tax=Orbilia brochopaga TaxID=3140254 RepID=A0AAV9UX50_9PEZI
MLATAKNNHTSANPHIGNAIPNPSTYNISPAFSTAGRASAAGIKIIAISPSFIIAYAPDPRGPTAPEDIRSRDGPKGTCKPAIFDQCLGYK